MRRGLMILLAAVLALTAGLVLADATGKAEVVASGGGTFQKEYTSTSAIPSAWIIYEESGGSFTINRYYQGVAETHTFTIPSNTSITLSTPSVEDSSGTFIVKMVIAGNADDVVFIPVSR